MILILKYPVVCFSKCPTPVAIDYYKIDGNLNKILRLSINLAHAQIVHMLIALLRLLCTYPTPILLFHLEYIYTNCSLFTVATVLPMPVVCMYMYVGIPAVMSE